VAKFSRSSSDDEPRRDIPGGGNAMVIIVLVVAAGLTLLVCGGLVLSLFMLAPSAGRQVEDLSRPATKPTAPTAPAKPVITRAEFKQKVVGMTTDELIDAFGRPERTTDFEGYTKWYYNDLVTDPVTGKLDQRTTVIVRKGKVTEVD
jgi:hypothetical protein